MCGDATSPDDVAALMKETQADLWLTDPPHNVNYEGGTGLTIQNDNMSDVKFREFLRSAFDNVKENMKPGAAFYIFQCQPEANSWGLSRHRPHSASMPDLEKLTGNRSTGFPVDS